jgi:long-chain fatty acid transport protein
MGKANAVTGSVTDPNAVFYNPAGLSFSKGYALFLGSNLTFLRNMNFKDADTNVTTHGGDRFFYAGQACISAQLTDWLHFGVGLFAPFGGGITWPNNWPGRTNILYTNIVGLYINPVFSFKITPKLSIAAGFQLVRGTLELKQGTPDGIGIAHLGFEGWGYGGNLGIMYQASKKVSLGIAYRSRVKVPMSGGRVDFQNVPPELNNNFVDQGASTRITMPDIISLGVTVKPIDVLSIGVDVDYIAWDTWDKLPITFANGTLPNVVNPSNYHGAAIFRVGAEYDTEIGFLFRAGVAYEQSPAPRDLMAAALPDPNNVDFTFSVRLPSLAEWFVGDLGYMLQWGLPTGVDASVMSPAGKYSRFVHVFAFSGVVRFGVPDELGSEPTE